MLASLEAHSSSLLFHKIQGSRSKLNLAITQTIFSHSMIIVKHRGVELESPHISLLLLLLLLLLIIIVIIIIKIIILIKQIEL